MPSGPPSRPGSPWPARSEVETWFDLSDNRTTNESRTLRPTTREGPALVTSGRRRSRYPGRMAATCDFCGTSVPGEDTPLTWTTAVENGKPRTFCDVCSREHLRAIESKLDSEWW